MNDTRTSETTGTELAVNDRTTDHFVQPVWSTNRHAHGIDVEVQLPGVAKDALNVQTHGSSLVIEAARRAAPGKLLQGDPAPDGYRLKLRLGESLDAEKLTARLADGLLRLSIPLVEAAKPKSIEIL